MRIRKVGCDCEFRVLKSGCEPHHSLRMVSENRTACHPKSVARTATITEHARCLNGTSAIFVGNSETIELLEWLMSALRCCHRGLRLVSRFKHCSRKSSNFRFTATCKQDLYTEQPYHAECEGLIGPDASPSAANRANATYFATSTLDFRWKTDMFSQRHRPLYTVCRCTQPHRTQRVSDAPDLLGSRLRADSSLNSSLN